MDFTTLALKVMRSMPPLPSTPIELPKPVFEKKSTYDP